jgi:hypothetical protein
MLAHGAKMVLARRMLFLGKSFFEVGTDLAS